MTLKHVEYVGQCLIVCIFLQIFYYSSEIFKAAGVPDDDVATVAVGVVLVVFTFITVSI